MKAMREFRGGSLIGLLTLVMLVGGCVQADPAPTSTQSASSALVAPSSVAPSSEDVGGPSQADFDTPLDPPPPLARFAPFMDGPPEEPGVIEARALRWGNQQNTVAQCMADKGFRYVPISFRPTAVNPVMQMDDLLGSLPVPRLSDDRDVVNREGYGVMGTPEARYLETETLDDPNVAYRETLNSSEADAYDRALYGDYNDPTVTSGASCSGQAMARYPDPGEPNRAEVFEAEFRDLKMEAWNLVRVDDMTTSASLNLSPAAVELNRQWESCMNGQGYVFDDGVKVRNPELAMGLALRTRPDGTVGPLHTVGPTAEVPDDEKSLLGSAPERKIALADFDCRVETDYMAQLTKIRVDMDQRFITDHQAELDRLVAAAQSW